ncbi:MAG TPA: GNAT family N-acetyltransferase [Candidatus Acidoferrum sp.]|nr:GNAT family N-acetyltransferase [Candidatus Acidoferrum sp.]
MTWTRIDISSDKNFAEANTFCRSVMEKSGEAHIQNDLEWIATILGRSAIVLFINRDVPAFGLAFRRTRPLKFFLGEIPIYRKALRRIELGAGPVIASNCAGNNEGTDFEKEFLAAACAELSPGEVLCFEGLRTAGRLSRIISDDPEIHKNFQVLYLGKPYAHHFARLPNSFDAYLKQLSTRSRKSLQYSRNILRRECDGDVAVVCFDIIESVDRFLDDAIEISKKTYQWRLLGLGLRDREKLRTTFRFAAERGWLRCYILYCKSVPVAFMVGYQYANSFFYIDVGYDPEWAKFSVGSVLQREVMEDLYRRGNTPSVFDFSTGYGSHKSRFGKEAREEVNILLLPAALGNRMLAAAWRGVNTVSDTAVRSLDGLGMKQSLKKAIHGVKIGGK